MTKNKRNYLIVSCLLLIILFVFLGTNIYKQYRYSADTYYNYYIDTSKKSNISNNDNNTNNTFATIIDHTIKYENQIIKSRKDAIKLINDLSIQQEEKCNNKLINLEKELKEKTNIYGINFCEIDEETSKKIANTIAKVYELYPIIKEYITNITIVNDSGDDSYIAAFKPAFTFATSNDTSKFPFVIKTQIFMNASYYLNTSYLNNVIGNAKSTNYFPKDTTKESLIAHELGHALTYVLAIKNNKSINTLLVEKDNFKLYADTLNDYTTSSFSKSVVQEAYKNYINKYGVIKEETFRENISLYANSKEGTGKIIYNETIAEAFHDYYLHRENSRKESIEIINVLNSYI